MVKKILLTVFIICMFAVAKADVRLPAIISSGMVLQQNTKVNLWGWAEPGEQIYITTSWSNNKDSVVTGAHASWVLAIATPAAGGPHTITLRGHNTITLNNVLIGEVWVASGQSNMDMNYHWGLPEMDVDLPFAKNAAIRFFKISKRTADAPQLDVEGEWVMADSNTVKSFSAIAWYFGKKLNAQMNIPVGLIQASWGGTPAETWTPADVVTADEKMLAASKKIPPSKYWPVAPGVVFNAMIAPVTRFGVAGTIWYQGEGNTAMPGGYHAIFPAMIQAWRTAWKKEMPFYYVQLAPFNYGNNLAAALVREGQAKTLSLPNTGMVVTTDLAADTTDIHPKQKKAIGYRLADIALVNTYKQKIQGTFSPMFKSMQVVDNKAILFFYHAQNGLVHKGKNVTGLFISGDDKIFYPARAKMESGKIIAWNKNVKRPVAVRYAFSNTAQGNILNMEGMPLAPFRTDNWDQ